MKYRSKEVKMVFIKRFFDTKKGDIVFIGNVLGLSKLSNVDQNGFLCSIDAFFFY